MKMMATSLNQSGFDLVNSHFEQHAKPHLSFLSAQVNHDTSTKFSLRFGTERLNVTMQLRFHSGLCQIPEDCAIVSLPFLGVVDSVSIPYYPEPKRFGDKQRTSGQLVTDTVWGRAISTDSEQALIPFLLETNRKVREMQQSHGISVDDPGLVAGAAGAFGHITDCGHLDTAAWADAVIAWELKSGEVGATDIQTRLHDHILNADLARDNDKQRHFTHFTPEMQRKHANNPRSDDDAGYGVMNGQLQFEQMIMTQRFKLSDLRRIVFITDGMFAGFTADPSKLAEYVITKIKQKGLQSLLDQVHSNGSKQPEATGLSLEFS